MPELLHWRVKTVSLDYLKLNLGSEKDNYAEIMLNQVPAIVETFDIKRMKVGV